MGDSSSKARFFLIAFQLTLPRVAAGWLFAILTSNFNRIAIYELGIAAVVVTSMLGLYQFLSPFQVIYGRMADRLPMFGYHRTPYIIIGMLISALAVASLPYIAIPMAENPDTIFFFNFPYAAYFVGFVVLIIFGIGFAMAGANHLALVAEVIPPRSRGLVTAAIWTMLIVGMIVSLQFIRGFMPEYNLETMKALYAISIPVVAVVTILGVIGVEKRTTAPARVVDEPVDPELGEAHRTLWAFIVDVCRNRNVRNFFFFIFLFQMGYSLQDNILEVFGAQVLQMTVGETGKFQQIWGVGAIFGMFIMGFLVFRGGVSKRIAITFGIIGIAISLFLLAYGAQFATDGIVNIALLMMGFFNGFALVGTLTAMMEFTTDAERGAYIGLWGLAISFATGLSSVVAGLLVTLMIESGLFAPQDGYSTIFVFEGLLVLISLWFLWHINHSSLSHKIDRNAMSAAMEADMA